MEKILITGISGQDGIFLSSLLSKENVEVLGVSRTAKKELLEKKFEVVNLSYPKNLNLIDTNLINYNHTHSLLTEFRPDKIFNLSGPSSVYDSFLDDNIQKNIEEIFNNLTNSLINQNYFPTFIQASSSEMFGKQNTNNPLTELSTFNPTSPYAVGKLNNHKKIEQFRDIYEWNISSAILFNHESELRPKNYLIKKIITSCLNIKNKKVDFLEVGSTEYVRDWSYAGDIAKGLKVLSENKLDSSYVVGSGLGTSINKVIEIVFEYIGIDSKDKIKVNNKLLREDDPKIIVSNPNKIQKHFNWKAEEEISKWLKKIIDYEINFQNLN